MSESTDSERELNTKSVQELQSWLRIPSLYGIPIFDILGILLLVHWTYSYIKYITIILIIVYIQKSMGFATTKTEVPMILSKILGWNI
jgi:hypothetical protein